MCDFAEVRERVLESIGQLYVDHIRLLEIDANERSITHWLANEVQARFQEWTVDCEYNRKGELPKKLKETDERVLIWNTDGRTAYPDIIVHMREEPVNLLILEAKKATSDDGPERDLEKLAFFGDHSDYRYRFGAFVMLAKQEVFIQWFVDGMPKGAEWLAPDGEELLEGTAPEAAELLAIEEDVQAVLEGLGFDV